MAVGGPNSGRRAGVEAAGQSAWQTIVESVGRGEGVAHGKNDSKESTAAVRPDLESGSETASIPRPMIERLGTDRERRRLPLL